MGQPVKTTPGEKKTSGTQAIRNNGARSSSNPKTNAQINGKRRANPTTLHAIHFSCGK